MTAVGTKVFASEYNAIQAAISTVLGIGAGASGYGQAVLSSQVSTSSSITVTQWSNLRADLLKAYLHQGTPGDLPLPSVPQKSTLPYTIVTYSDYNRYLDLSTVITANAGITPPAGQATLQTFSTGSYTSSWNGQLTHSVVLTFANANQARYYFNTGGNIQFSASLINYPGYPAYGSQSASYAKNSDWNMLLNNMGTTTFGRNSTVNSGNGTGQTILSAVGYFQLTTGEQNIYRKTTSSASYTPNQYDLYANVDATGAVITFNIRFKDLATTSGTGFGATDENVEGLLTSLIQGYYASGSYVAATPPATTATFAGGAVVAPPPPPPPPPIYEPPPPYVLVYNEVVSAPASVQGNTGGISQTLPFSIIISSGSPNANFSWSIAGEAANLGGNGTLNASGAATVSLTQPNLPGNTYTYTFSFAGSGNTRTVAVQSTAALVNPSYGPFTASPTEATNGATITLSATVYNIRALPIQSLYSMIVYNQSGASAAQWQGIQIPGSGTVTITNTFTFQQAQAPYTTAFVMNSFPPQISGPTITLYVAPVTIPSSYGVASWSPVGPVATGTSVTFSAVANNAVGDVYAIGNTTTVIGESSSVLGVITTNPQTVSKTVAAYSWGDYIIGTFLLNSLSPAVAQSTVYITAPVVTPPEPTYAVSPGSVTPNEGGTISVSITTTNVSNGTYLYWQLAPTISGLTPVAGSGDFSSAMSGSVQINSNAGSINLGVLADELTEGSEFISVRVYSDSGLTNQVAYVSFAIQDTSTTPVVYNETVTGPSTATAGINFNVNLSGGAPNTSVTWTETEGSTATFTLDGSGNAVFNAINITYVRTYTWTFVFAATGHSRTYSVTIVAATPPPPPPPPPSPPPPPPYVPPAFVYQVTWAAASWDIDVPANGAGVSQSVSVYCSSGSGTYDVQETSRPNAVAVAVDGVSGPARITQSISAGQTRSHTVTVYANPPGAGYVGAFSAGGVSLNWTATFRGSPRVTAYTFIPTTFAVGQYVLFAVDVADADGVGWGANIYTNNFYAYSGSGTVSGNNLHAIIVSGFIATTGINLGTFYLAGVGVVQTQVNL